jgi:serine/threonine-protein kinase
MGHGGSAGSAANGRSAPPGTLVVEPNDGVADEITRLFGEAGATVRRAPDAEAAWRAFAADRPDLILTAITTPRRDAAWLLRRMREDYLGALPPVIGLCEQSEVVPGLKVLELDGVLLRPLSGDALRTLARRVPTIQDAERRAARLRDLFDLSLLGDDLDAALATVIERLALAFRVSDCVMWGPAHEGRWPKTRRPPGPPEARAGLLWRCDLALTTSTTLVAAEHASHVVRGVAPSAPARSVLATAIEAPGAAVAMGALCLVDDGARVFTEDEHDALVMVGRRLARELTFRAAHDRLASAYVDLREHAQRDPLTGALAQAAFVDHLADTLGAAPDEAASGLAIVDVIELRHINERHGHAAGDAALRHVVQIAEAHGFTVGRTSGDELGLILPLRSVAAQHDALDAMRLFVAAAPLPAHGLEIPVRVRVGFTTLVPAEDADVALTRAQAALAEARRLRAHVAHVAAGDPFGAPGGTGINESDAAAFADADLEAGLLPAGATLGGMYQILHEISRGAMGVVYRAEDLGLGRPVAIKVLRADLAGDAELVQRFRAEAALLASLRHENLVQVHAFGARESDIYFVMELVEGESLADLMQRAEERAEPIAAETVASIVNQVCGALDVMHRAGAVHRDVKPANILLDRGRDRAVLVDVGVAKRSGGGGDVAGTPGFAAPESFTQGEEGPATDVYGLAATAYMMLTNLAPFGGGEVSKVVRRQLGDRPAAPSALRSELSAGVDRVLLRALAPDPAARYAGALEFAHALGHALSEAIDGAHDERSERSEERTLPDLTWGHGGAPGGGPQTRGALFRVAYKILGNRLGSAWVRRAVEETPRLGEVLRPTAAPRAWYGTDALIAILRAVPAGVRDPRKVARELGRAAMTSTFAGFYGADPAAHTPEQLLGDAPHYFHEIHDWGEIAVEAGAGFGRVHLVGTPQNGLLCCMLEGMFERIAELAGAAQAKAHHDSCETLGEAACVFAVEWNPG